MNWNPQVYAIFHQSSKSQLRWPWICLCSNLKPLHSMCIIKMKILYRLLLLVVRFSHICSKCKQPQFLYGYQFLLTECWPVFLRYHHNTNLPLPSVSTHTLNPVKPHWGCRVTQRESPHIPPAQAQQPLTLLHIFQLMRQRLSKTPANSNNPQEMLPDSTELDQHQTPPGGLWRIYTWNPCVYWKGLDRS